MVVVAPATFVPVDLTRFRGEYSPWGEEVIHDAEESPSLPA
jgi:hypothetical protein